MRLQLDLDPATSQPEHFPCGEPATAGSFKIEAEDLQNLDGPEGRAARIVKRLGLEKFCRETELTKPTARRIQKDGLKPRSRCWLAVIACLKKHGG